MAEEITTYKLLNKLESFSGFKELIKRGIIPVNWVEYKMIYEFHKMELKRLNGAKRQAKTNTAEEFKISERSVYLILEKMS